jgi:hypothetical protein
MNYSSPSSSSNLPALDEADPKLFYSVGRVHTSYLKFDVSKELKIICKHYGMKHSFTGGRKEGYTLTLSVDVDTTRNSSVFGYYSMDQRFYAEMCDYDDDEDDDDYLEHHRSRNVIKVHGNTKKECLVELINRINRPVYVQPLLSVKADVLESCYGKHVFEPHEATTRSRVEKSFSYSQAAGNLGGKGANYFKYSGLGYLPFQQSLWSACDITSLKHTSVALFGDTLSAPYHHEITRRDITYKRYKAAQRELHKAFWDYVFLSEADLPRPVPSIDTLASPQMSGRFLTEAMKIIKKNGMGFVSGLIPDEEEEVVPTIISPKYEMVNRKVLFGLEGDWEYKRDTYFIPTPLELETMFHLHTVYEGADTHYFTQPPKPTTPPPKEVPLDRSGWEPHVYSKVGGKQVIVEDARATRYVNISCPALKGMRLMKIDSDMGNTTTPKNEEERRYVYGFKFSENNQSTGYEILKCVLNSIHTEEFDASCYYEEDEQKPEDLFEVKFFDDLRAALAIVDSIAVRPGFPEHCILTRDWLMDLYRESVEKDTVPLDKVIDCVYNLCS